MKAGAAAEGMQLPAEEHEGCGPPEARTRRGGIPPSSFQRHGMSCLHFHLPSGLQNEELCTTQLVLVCGTNNEVSLGHLPWSQQGDGWGENGKFSSHQQL